VNLAAQDADADVTYTFGANASAAGIEKIVGSTDGDGAGTAHTITVDAAGMTTAVEIDLSYADNTDIGYVVAGSSANDTITLGGAEEEGNFVQGGAGADAINLGVIAASDDTLRVNLTNDLAAGTTLANADVVTNFNGG